MDKDNSSVPKNAILFGMACAIVSGAFSLAHLIIDIIYLVNFNSYCSDTGSTECTTILKNHLIVDQGINYFLFVSTLDLVILIFCIFITIRIKQLALVECTQYAYMTILVLSFIANILSYIQQPKYVDSSMVTYCESSSVSGSSLCSFVSVQQAYLKCLIPFPVVQVFIAISLKIYLKVSGKQEQMRKQKEMRNKQIEESTLNLPMFNSKGRPYTVRELYNLGKM